MVDTGQMTPAEAISFVKAQDVVLEIGKLDTLGQRPSYATGGSPEIDVTSGLDSNFGTNGIAELNASTSADLGLDKNGSEFNFLGSDGWTDEIHVTKRISQSFETEIQKSSSGGIDAPTQLLIEAGNESDKEVFLRVLLFLGDDGDSTKWYGWYYTALLSNFSLSLPGDNVVGLSFTASSVGTAYKGLLTGADATSRPVLSNA